MMPDLWMPPVEGVKATIDHRPTIREEQAQQYAAEVLQNRYERWLQWHYSRVLASMRRDFEALDHVPDDAEIVAIVHRYDSVQMDVLRRMYLQVYPSAASMVLDDGTLKSYRRTETKAELSLEQQRILQWIEEQLNTSVQSMAATTASILQTIRIQTLQGSELRLSEALIESLGPNAVVLDHTDVVSRFDSVDFMRRLESSGLFDTARARRIAVTETNTAVNESLSRAADDAADGRPMVKSWRTSGRTNVRRYHRAMRDTTIDAEEFYEVPNRNGGYDLMDYPGDRAHGAGPENFMNCHCKSFKRLAEYE